VRRYKASCRQEDRNQGDCKERVSAQKAPRYIDQLVENQCFAVAKYVSLIEIIWRRQKVGSSQQLLENMLVNEDNEPVGAPIAKLQIEMRP
jgi:hypothetical protein